MLCSLILPVGEAKLHVTETHGRASFDVCFDLSRKVQIAKASMCQDLVAVVAGY